MMYLNLGKGGGGQILDLIEYGPLTFLHTNIAKIKQVNRYITKVKS